MPTSGYNGSFVIGPQGDSKNQELSVLLATVIVCGSYIEAVMGSSLAKFLRTNIEMGVTIYSAVKGGNAQRDMVKEAAQRFFDEADADGALFLDLMESAQLVSRDRNLVAHGLWGWPVDEPPVYMVRLHQADYLSWHREVSDAGHTRVDLAAFDPNRAEAWIATDFNNLIADLRFVERLLRLFWDAREMPPPAGVQARVTLDTELKIEKRRFAPLSPDGRNIPPTPKSWPHRRTSPTPQ